MKVMKEFKKSEQNILSFDGQSFKLLKEDLQEFLNEERDLTQEKIDEMFENYTDDYWSLYYEEMELYYEASLQNINCELEKLEYPYNLFFISGSAGLWNGTSSINENQLIELDVIEGFLKYLGSYNLQDLYIYLHNDFSIEIGYSHHDGANSYLLTPAMNLTKAELIQYHEDSDVNILDYLKLNNLKINKKNLIEGFIDFKDEPYTIY